MDQEQEASGRVAFSKTYKSPITCMEGENRSLGHFEGSSNVPFT